MKRNFRLKRLAAAMVAGAIVIIAASWQTSPGHSNQNTKDTTPHKKVKDIDEALAELEKARAELDRTIDGKSWEKEMKEAMKDFDATKIKLQIEQALKEVDAAKIQAEIQKSLTEVDVVKIQKEVEQALKEVDTERIRAEVSKALKDVDAAKIKAELSASLASLDVEKMRAEIEKIKEVDLKKMEEELKKVGPEIEKSMASARESMEKAKEELTAYKYFIDVLQKDGLINKKENYRIEYKDGELAINGKKQPAEVTNKYSDFLKNRKDFTITKEADDFNISND